MHQWLIRLRFFQSPPDTKFYLQPFQSLTAKKPETTFARILPWTRNAIHRRKTPQRNPHRSRPKTIPSNPRRSRGEKPPSKSPKFARFFRPPGTYIYRRENTHRFRPKNPRFFPSANSPAPPFADLPATRCESTAARIAFGSICRFSLRRLRPNKRPKYARSLPF